MKALVLAVVSLLPTPEFCLAYRQGYRAAICRDLGAGCIASPHEFPSCPSDGGSPRSGYDRGYDDGERARARDVR